MTRQAFENAIRVNAAIGGSTNAVIHLLAIAGPPRRAAVPRRLRRAGPRRADPAQPAAERPVPDGGLLLRRRPARGDARARRRTACCTPARSPSPGRRRGQRGRTRRAGTARSSRPWPSRSSPPAPVPRCSRGNLAPDGAVIKQSASSPHLLKHRGPALVFDSPEDYYAVSQRPGPRRRREHRAGHPVLRPAWLPGHARGVQRGAAEEAAAARRSATWCGSATAGCPAPPTARSCCTSPPRPRRAARWPWSGPATGSRWTCRPAR